MMTNNNLTLDTAEEPSPTASLVWILILTLAGVGRSLVISCVTPFAGLAVALAGTVRLAAALRAMTAIWLANQFIGFAFFHFPRTPNSVSWGLASGAAALLSVVLAAAVLKRATALPILARAALALVLGFAAYEAVHFMASLYLGAAETFSPAIIAQLALSNAAWLVGLIALNELVAILCKPWLGVAPRLLKAA